MTRRQAPRDEPGRRSRPFHLPHLHRPRLPRWQQLVLAGLILAVGLFVALRHPEALRSTVNMLSPPIHTPGETIIADRPAEEAVLERRRQGLMTLVQDAARGPLVSRDTDRVLFLVDQSLVAALLATQVPREYVVEDTYRIWVTGARITFEDGLALVRLDGRASLVGSDEQVFADVAVFGDLEILHDQPSAAVLRARINLIAVDVRRVEVAGKRDVDTLVERLGKSRLSAFAALASELEIPVRHEHEIEMPAVDEGPVRIQATTLALRLTLIDVKAFKGRLWISMAASFDAATVPPPTALQTLPVAAASPSKAEKPEQRVARLEYEVAQLRGRFITAAERDPQVVKGSAAEGHLTAVVPAALFEDVGRRVAAHYLDRVDVQLDGLHVEKTGEIQKDTLFGKIDAGGGFSVGRIRLSCAVEAPSPECDHPNVSADVERQVTERAFDEIIALNIHHLMVALISGADDDPVIVHLRSRGLTIADLRTVDGVPDDTDVILTDKHLGPFWHHQAYALLLQALQRSRMVN